MLANLPTVRIDLPGRSHGHDRAEPSTIERSQDRRRYRPSSRYPPWTNIALAIAGSASEVAGHLTQTVVGADHVVIGVLSRSDDTIEELFDRCAVSLMDVETELENAMGFA